MKWRKLRKLLLIAGVLLVCACLAAWWFYHSLSKDLPDVRRIPDPIASSKIYALNGSLLAEFYTQRRTIIPGTRIPDKMVQALIAIEDHRFFKHNGIDPVGVVRALWRNLRKQRVVQGASTITMQTARNIFLYRYRSMERKLKEAILALKLEKHYSKQEILTIYFNYIYFGQGAYGLYEAARTYFDKPFDSLTLAEYALLAALPKAPYHYNPYRNPMLAIRRRNLVLRKMRRHGYIDFKEYADAVRAPIPTRSHEEQHFGSYFVDFVKQRLLDHMDEKKLYEGGLRIHTSLSPEIQSLAEKHLRQGLLRYQQQRPFSVTSVLAPEDSAFLRNWPDVRVAEITEVSREKARLSFTRPAGEGWLYGRDCGYRLGPLNRVFAKGQHIVVRPGGRAERFRLCPLPQAEGALVVLDLDSNAVRAMVGGLSYQRSQFNRATQAKRQPGSAFKPFVYAAALYYGYQPTSRAYDIPLNVPQYTDDGYDEEKGWQPSNFDGRYLGVLSLARAFFESRNTVSVRLVQEMGSAPVMALCRQAGMTSPLTPHLSLSLGSSAQSLLDLCHAYTVFPNLGRLKPLTWLDGVSDRYGRPILVKQAQARQVLRSQYAYTMVYLMQGVVQHGTGQQAKGIVLPAAGKTGTTNDFRDNWFIGFTAQYLIGVWVGRDDNAGLGRNMTGGKTACPIWAALAQDLPTDGRPMFQVPHGVLPLPADAAAAGEAAGAHILLPLMHTENQVDPEETKQQDYFDFSEGNERPASGPPAG